MSDVSPSTASPDRAVLRALAEGRGMTREMSDQLLTHLPDVGDMPAQRLLDGWVEQAADTLRALSEALEERLLELGRPVAGSAEAFDAPAVRPDSLGRRR